MGTQTDAGTLVMVGTRKGLWIGRSDHGREDWTWDGPHFDMQEVYSCMLDTRTDTPRLLAGAASSWVGPQVAYSDDLGASWTSGPDGGIRFPEDTDASVERIWQLHPAGPAAPEPDHCRQHHRESRAVRGRQGHRCRGVNRQGRALDVHGAGDDPLAG